MTCSEFLKVMKRRRRVAMRGGTPKTVPGEKEHFEMCEDCQAVVRGWLRRDLGELKDMADEVLEVAKAVEAA